MRTVRCARALAAAAVIAACAAPAAEAAGWRQVTSEDGSSIHQPGLVRTADGVLHVAWHHPTGPNTEDLLHTAISPAGEIGTTSPIQTGWTGFRNAGLTSDPAGIRVFFGAIRSTSSSDPQNDLNTALSSDGGASWVLQPGSIIQRGTQAYGSDVSATTRPDGTTLQAWAGTLGTWVHSGLTPVTPNHDFQAGIGNYGYDSNLAADAAGRTVMAWYSSAAGRLGVLAQDVAADGSPVGSPVTMPGTGDMQIGMLGRTPLSARAGGGFYVAYPTGYPAMTRVRLWRVGAGSAPVIARLGGSGSQPVAVAPAADGRLWVAWVTNGAAPKVLARRSNPAATRFGATVSGGRVAGSAAAYRLDASAAGNALDVLANFSIGVTSTTALFHRRLRPGLTLSASPGKLRRGRRATVRFTVRDAGDPVEDARVKAGGRTGITNGKGKVEIALVGAGKAVRAVASRSGYVSAKRRLKVRR